MIWHDYHLGHTISKATEDIRLWDSEKGIVEIHKDTLAIPIKLDDKENGYIFHGHGKLLLDTIVETEEGAIGDPVEKPLNKPFLMLGDTEETLQFLTKASEEDLTRMGYESKQALIDTAEDLFNRFFKNGRTHGRHRISENRSVIFAFQNQNDKLEILVAKGPKLVYTAEDIVFVSNRDKVVLKRPEEVVCSGNGKSVIINKDRSVIIKK
jgi:hypothetical protein